MTKNSRIRTPMRWAYGAFGLALTSIWMGMFEPIGNKAFDFVATIELPELPCIAWCAAKEPDVAIADPVLPPATPAAPEPIKIDSKAIVRQSIRFPNF